MRKITFEVRGELPPKKDGASSMWGKEREAQRLIALRREAYRALGDEPAVAYPIRLTLHVHITRTNSVKGNPKQAGDLDNYIAGVCDGLGSLTGGNSPKLHSLFCEQENSDIHPDRWSAIGDDSDVMKIVAEKALIVGGDWYRVEIEGT